MNSGEVRATFKNGFVRTDTYEVPHAGELIRIAEERYSHGNLARVEVWVGGERLRTVSIDGELF